MVDFSLSCFSSWWIHQHVVSSRFASHAACARFTNWNGTGMFIKKNYENVIAKTWRKTYSSHVISEQTFCFSFHAGT